MQLTTYWDFLRMILLETKALSALTYLSGCNSDWRTKAQLLSTGMITPIFLPTETCAHFLNSLTTLERTAQQMGMSGAAFGITRAREECLSYLALPIGNDANRLQKVVNHTERVLLTFMDELRSRHLFTLEAKHAMYFDLASPFGGAVESAFPSAGYDITEASKCRALRRWTASVMHLMRALEVGLAALARHYEVEAEANWNMVLNQIEAKSRQVGKKTHGSDEEQWAAEAALHLRFIKNAWRNHAMHPLEKYDEERAVAIYENCRSFMSHLAAKLTEV